MASFKEAILLLLSQRPRLRLARRYWLIGYTGWHQYVPIGGVEKMNIEEGL